MVSRGAERRRHRSAVLQVWPQQHSNLRHNLTRHINYTGLDVPEYIIIVPLFLISMVLYRECSFFTEPFYDVCTHIQASIRSVL